MQDQDTRTLDDVLDGERIAMVVTADQRARPMTIIERDGSRLWFLTDRGADWVEALPENEIVAIVISDPEDSLHVSLTGQVGLTDEADVLERLWSKPMEAWFDGADDPKLTALHVDVSDGEYWDGPDSGISRAIRGIASVVTGDGRELMGEQGDVTT
ncbi:MAG: pyridoxamine 5'-phosphate oxidase family protein [Nitriliruptor sp.]|uniref:pyridoxamine 5'-phosphate oxidase family protein n=1 Tax=Nitriliruptor sp. TaxID=2448056 RepID=UPI0034A044FD